jgi:gamma-glutamyltranspeptidase/glutathione hydrolase
MKPLGAVACGHPETARAAELILREGGNAFDAILAAHFMACVVEPVLASLGGGGFLLAHSEKAHRKHQRDVIYDFFTQTPHVSLPQDELDFHPIHANFGTTTQEFHIGLASVATPGTVRGVFKIHEDLGTMPLMELAQPAIEAARDGVVVNGFQAYILDIVSPIFSATRESRHQYQSLNHPDSLICEGEWLQQPQLANFLEALVVEGSDLFYRGEIAQIICDLSAREGGQLTLQDLSNYQVILRDPVHIHYKQHHVLTNPPPSCGGTLIAFALNLLEHCSVERSEFGSWAHLHALVEAMRLTNEARFDVLLDSPREAALLRLLDADLLQQYRVKIAATLRVSRGTTHMSVMDGMGNVASMTVSNGEGCGHVVPDTGIMLNNMLGEQDLNPDGFFRWPPNQRMASMMAPTLVFSKDGKKICLGSGGSNRLRTAILQVLINIIDFKNNLHDAVTHPRIHFENDLLSIEPGFEPRELQPLHRQYVNHKLWEQKNLFFGGVHAVMEHDGIYDGAGDQRRGGVARIIW